MEAYFIYKNMEVTCYGKLVEIDISVTYELRSYCATPTKE
jgi:hypothetical protein